MANRNKVRRVLLVQTLAFAILIIVSWLDELVQLPYWIFGSTGSNDWHEALWESAILAVVWLLVVSVTRMLAYPAATVQVCMWCRKISDGGYWLQTEEYFGAPATGDEPGCMCPSCRERWKDYQAAKVL